MSAGTPAPHVLVLDDDQATLGLYRDLLLDGGYSVTLRDRPPDVPSGVEALRPDLILLDLVFGGEERGWPFIQTIRQFPATADIPVLVCTAAVHLVERLQADLDAWSCQVILKPFDIDRLLAAIDACLGEGKRGLATG